MKIMQNLFKIILVAFLFFASLALGLFLRFSNDARTFLTFENVRIGKMLNNQAAFVDGLKGQRDFAIQKSEQLAETDLNNFCKENITFLNPEDKRFCFRKSKLTEEKGIEVDLTNKKALLYDGEKLVKILPLLYQSPEDKWFQSPTGYYRIGVKKERHWSSLFPVAMPYAVQYYEDFFMHGIPYFEDNTQVLTDFTGGCLRFIDEVAKNIFNFLKTGDQIVVYKTFDDLKIKSDFSSPVKLEKFWIRQRFGNPYRSFWAHSGDIENLKFDYYLHTGVDFAPALNNDNPLIYAIADGEISEIQNNDGKDHGFGNTIIIKHQINNSEIYSLYAHLDSVKTGLGKGSAVKKGEVIGVVGNSANGCRNYWRIGFEGCNQKSPFDTHLHFEIKTSSTVGNAIGGEACRRQNGEVRFCYGYTPDDSQKFGYLNPIEFLFEKKDN